MTVRAPRLRARPTALARWARQLLRAPLRALACLTWLTCLLCLTESAGAASVESVRRVLDDPAPAELTAQDRTALLERVATSQTRLLGLGDPEWRESRPQWHRVLERVRAELAPQIGQISASVQAARRSQELRYQRSVAVHVAQADVDAILAYYRTDEGQRYQALVRRLDRVMASGVATLRNPPAAPEPQPSVSEPDMQRYMRLLMMSKLFQTTRAKVELEQATDVQTNGYGTMVFVMGAAIAGHRDELEDLSVQYLDALPQFEAFEQTQAPTHFHQALAAALELPSAGSDDIASVIERFTRPKRAGWEKLYRDARGP